MRVEFKLRQTKIGYYIDVYLKGYRVIEGSNLYPFEEVAVELVNQLNLKQ